MFDIISKTEYWDSLDIPNRPPILDQTKYDLKHIQDSWIYKEIGNVKNLKILEVGGGNSRILRCLDKSNEMWNLDEFVGAGLGPKTQIEIEGVKVVKENMGEFSSGLPDDYFDIVFSVSVLEHVPKPEQVVDFFKDSARVMKRNGRMLHAIDVYVWDEPHEILQQRIDVYLRAVAASDLGYKSSPIIDRDLVFKCHFASNSDLGMYGWNKLAPNLKERRRVTQSTSVKMELTKE